MVAFGGPSGLFLSHIPMMQAPHAMQVVLRVGPPPGRSFSDGQYTFVPKPFDSNKLLDGTLKQLEGTFFKGNFEAGGTPIPGLTNVKVPILSAVHKATLPAEGPAPKKLAYTATGSGTDAYAFHKITGGAEPEFDHVLKLDFSGAKLTAEEQRKLQAGLGFTFGGANTLANAKKLKAGVTTTVELDGGRKVQVKIAGVMSLLVGPNFTP